MVVSLALQIEGKRAFCPGILERMRPGRAESLASARIRCSLSEAHSFSITRSANADEHYDEPSLPLVVAAATRSGALEGALRKCRMFAASIITLHRQS